MGSGGGRITGVVAGIVAAVALGIPEIHIVGHDLGTAALAAVLVGPVPDLQAALHHSHAALGEVLAHKFGGVAPGHDVNEVRFLFAGLGLEVPVNSQREGRHRGTAAGAPELGVTGQATHENDSIQHVLLLYSPLQTIRERMTPSAIRSLRSSSRGNAGPLTKVMST